MFVQNPFMRALRQHRFLFAVTTHIFLISNSVIAGIIFTIQSPTADQLCADIVAIKVGVISDYQLVSVIARIDSSVISLTLSGGSFLGSRNLSGYPKGYKTIVIKATDVFGISDSASRQILVNRPPALLVESPIPGTTILNESELRVQVSCVDDDTCLVCKSSRTGGYCAEDANPSISYSIPVFLDTQSQMAPLTSVLVKDQHRFYCQHYFVVYNEIGSKMREIYSFAGQFSSMTPQQAQQE